jgi:pimeloyl-ACP methyl ester carboxylesterase
MPPGPDDGVDTGTVSVGGIRTFHRFRPGDGIPTLFVHGNPTNSADWQEFLERMSSPAFAPDLPGFGRSERPDPERFDCSMYRYADFLIEYLDTVGVDRYRLVVHDWGGVGLLSAMRQPERVDRLVICSAVPFLPGYRWHRLARIWRTRGLGEAFVALWTPALLGPALREARGDWSKPEPEFVRMIEDGMDRGTLDAVLRLYRSAPEDELARAGRDLASLTCPALVVWPDRDRYIGAEFGPAYAAALPDAELLEVPGAGHWPWRERPWLVDRMVEFLESD